MVVVCVYCFRLHYISQMFDVTSVGQKKNYNNYNYLLLRAAYLFVRALVHIHCFMLPSGPLWRFTRTSWQEVVITAWRGGDGRHTRTFCFYVFIFFVSLTALPQENEGLDLSVSLRLSVKRAKLSRESSR